MARPSLLILDEPCTGLDLKARANMLQSVSKICREKKSTVVYVTHHIEEIVNEVTQVLMIKGGKIFFKGPKKEALTKKRMRALFD